MVCALVTWPKFPGRVGDAGAVALGAFKLTMFSTLSASARNWRLRCSRTLNVREIARSKSLYAAWVRKFRGVLPSTGAPLVGAFLASAVLLNQQAAVPTGAPGVPSGFKQLPLLTLPTRRALSVLLPSRLASAPLRTVNGNPLCNFKIGETDHPLTM